MTIQAALAAVALSLWSIPTSGLYIDGLATYYAPGRMDEVITNRGLSLPPGFESGVALNRKGDLSRVVWLRWADGAVTGPHLVVDCAKRTDFQARENRRPRYVVEVSAELAGEMGFYGLGPVPVRVLFLPGWPDQRQLPEPA